MGIKGKKMEKARKAVYRIICYTVEETEKTYNKMYEIFGPGYVEKTFDYDDGTQIVEVFNKPRGAA